MSIKSWAVIITFITFFIQTSDIQAQIIQKSYTIEWEDPLIFSPDENNTIELLYFKDAISDETFPSLPLFFEKIPIDHYVQDYTYTIGNIQYVPLSKSELELIPKDFNQSELKINIRTVIEKKNHFTSITFLPILKNRDGNYVKITSLSFTYQGASKSKSLKSRSYAENSILQSGNWYKISISKSGIFKVTYDDLVNLGVPVSGLASSNISLFGNGGGKLAESNSIDRFDDLQENPIQLFDGGDNTFDKGDYFIFYGQGPHTWVYSSITNYFTHSYNIYSDYAYYYINTDAGIGEKKRIVTVDNSFMAANQNATTYTHYDFYEVDEKNFGESGQKWFGDLFDITTEHTYSFSLPSYIATSARISLAGAFISATPSYIQVYAKDNYIGKLSAGAATGDNIAIYSDADLIFTPSSSTINLTLNYNKPNSSSSAYLDWIELQATCNLQMHSAQVPFCNTQTIGTGNITQYSISNANANTTVWDVTNPTNAFRLGGTLADGTFAFKSPSDTLHKFVAFNGSSYYSVNSVGKVSNQNLHNSEETEMVIVTYPDFSSQAERLAQYRRSHDGLTVKVVTPQQIYNEFSSGAQDPTAIRDYMKLIYDKSGGNNPKYLLLVGRPSYDYRGRVTGTKNYVPNYQSNSSINETDFRSNDDYFGLLDENEGANCIGMVDVSIGRFPVTSLAQAKIAVDKTLRYSSESNLITDPNSSLVSNLADWRNMLTFVADDQNGTTHINTADLSAKLVANSNKNINFDKIYCDAYQQVSYSGGQRYPDVNDAINNRMQRGSLVFSYVGHGGANGWAVERILEISDLNKWTNLYNQPLMVTLTCEFAWYDRKVTSPGEMIFLNQNGGAAGLITTSRVAFTGSNHQYAMNLFSGLFDLEDNHYKTFGDLNRIAKNAAGGATGGLNMIFLMGDPSLKLAVPRYKVLTDSINGISVSGNLDTLKALSKVTIKGRITDENGNLLSDFNGNVFPSVFDKAITQGTLQNDPDSYYYEFEVQKSLLFRGNASVKNGLFEFSFIVPKDINYSYGPGKISYYARNNNSDAAGYFIEAIIGGFSSNPIEDNNGPEIALYMNDEKFVNGGTTNQNPTLLVKLKDEFGINTTGNGIGHDIVAILDDATDAPIILNDYYQAVQDSFNCGTIRYPLQNIALGSHTIKVRAWDIINNFSESTLNFEVVSDEELTIDHVLNYPNPFTTHTEFYFEHNKPGETFDILVQVFTISGKLIKTIESTQFLEGNRSNPIVWNGLDDFGDKLGKGVYLYRLKIRNQEGKTAEKIEKLVIL